MVSCEILGQSQRTPRCARRIIPGDSVLDVLSRIATVDVAGDFLRGVAGAAGDWIYEVNGVAPMVPITHYRVRDGDSVTLRRLKKA